MSLKSNKLWLFKTFINSLWSRQVKAMMLVKILFQNWKEPSIFPLCRLHLPKSTTSGLFSYTDWPLSTWTVIYCIWNVKRLLLYFHPVSPVWFHITVISTVISLVQYAARLPVLCSKQILSTGSNTPWGLVWGSVFFMFVSLHTYLPFLNLPLTPNF